MPNEFNGPIKIIVIDCWQKLDDPIFIAVISAMGLFSMGMMLFCFCLGRLCASKRQNHNLITPIQLRIVNEFPPSDRTPDGRLIDHPRSGEMAPISEAPNPIGYTPPQLHLVADRRPLMAGEI